MTINKHGVFVDGVLQTGGTRVDVGGEPYVRVGSIVARNISVNGKPFLAQSVSEHTDPPRVVFGSLVIRKGGVFSTGDVVRGPRVVYDNLVVKQSLCVGNNVVQEMKRE